MLTGYQCETIAYHNGYGELTCARCFESETPEGEHEPPSDVRIEKWHRGLEDPPDGFTNVIRYSADEFGHYDDETDQYYPPPCEQCGDEIE